VGQERPQPGSTLGIVGAAEEVAFLEGSGQGLLHQVVRVELAAQSAAKPGAGQ
jgi:hypothetical protein